MGKVLLQGYVYGEEVRLKTLKGREFLCWIDGSDEKG